MSIDTARYWAEVPEADAEPTAGATSVRRAKIGRRTVFKSLGVLGGALALNVVSALPSGRYNRAEAVAGEEYKNHCAGFDGWPGYNNNSATCVGATYSKSYCGADGWFLRGSGTCWNSYAVKECGDGPYKTKKLNAWRWTRSGTRYRCADGKVAVCGGTTFYICAWPNPKPV